MDAQVFLEKKIGELAEERKQLEKDLEIINDKIAQADAKKGAEPGTPNYHKWSTILTELEKDLQKTNGRIHYIEVDTEEKRKRLEDFREKAAQAEAAKAALPQRVLEMSVDELSELTAEEIAMLHQYELKQSALAEAERKALEEDTDATQVPDASPDAAVSKQEKRPPASKPKPAPSQNAQKAPAPQASTSAPPAKQPEPADSSPPNAQEPTGKAIANDGQALPRALSKVAENATGTLTLAEFELIVGTYAEAIGKEVLTAKEEKMLDLLEASLLKINRKHAKLRESWVRLAANA